MRAKNQSQEPLQPYNTLQMSSVMAAFKNGEDVNSDFPTTQFTTTSTGATKFAIGKLCEPPIFVQSKVQFYGQ